MIELFDLVDDVFFNRRRERDVVWNDDQFHDRKMPPGRSKIQRKKFCRKKN
jgi:hypothetical protein